MKSLRNFVFILILIAITSPIFAQNTDKDDTYYTVSQYLQKIFEKTPEGIRVKILNSLAVNVPTTVTAGTKTVSGTAAALASSTPAKTIIITNDNSSGNVYWGASGVTTSTGQPIKPGMSWKISIDDPAKIYVIGDAVTIRYVVLN